MKEITVEIKRLDKDVALPKYAKPGDAGLDLCASQDVELLPGKRAMIPTGLAIALPEGFAGFVQPRSGLAVREGLSIVNTPGLVDSGYRGELKIIAINTDDENTISIKRGDRIAQLVIQEVPIVDLVEVDELSETERGASGFGSSGK